MLDCSLKLSPLCMYGNISWHQYLKIGKAAILVPIDICKQKIGFLALINSLRFTKVLTSHVPYYKIWYDDDLVSYHVTSDYF